MKNFIFILAISLFCQVSFGQVEVKRTLKPQEKQRTTKKPAVTKLKPTLKLQTIVGKEAAPGKSPEEIARIKASNWLAPFKNYGNYYTADNINTLKVLDLSTGSPIINGVSRTDYMADDSLVHLLQFTGLERLTTTTWMTDKGLDYIGSMQGLNALYMGKTSITDAGLQKIANLQNLETLVLFHTSITNNGMQIIAQDHPGLRILNIGNTAITDAGLAYLSNLPYLENLILSRGTFTDAAIPYILPLSNLKLISIEFTQISQAGKDQLRTTFPNATIID